MVGAEHADVQGESAPAVFAAAGRWTEVRDHRDLAGRPRYLTAAAGDDEDDRVTAERYPTDTDEQREAAIDAASLAVQRGELVVLPTDTVYGMAADAFDPAAVTALLAAKGRGREMPPPVLVSAATTLDALATGVPGYARALVEEFWPGPADPRLPPAALAAVGPRRHPRHGRHPDARPRGRPARCSSAPARSRSARPTLTGQPGGHRRRRRPRRCSASTVAVIVDAGPSPGGEASTIIDVTGEQGRVLRRGALSLERAQRRARAARRDADGRGLIPVREYLLVFLVAAAVTYLLTVVAREIALRTGAVAEVRDRDVHAEPIPYLGGLAMLGGLVGGVPRRARAAVPVDAAARSSSRTPVRCSWPARWSAASACSTTSSSWTR